MGLCKFSLIEGNEKIISIFQKDTEKQKLFSKTENNPWHTISYPKKMELFRKIIRRSVRQFIRSPKGFIKEILHEVYR